MKASKTKITPKPFTDPWGLYQQIVRYIPDKSITGKKVLDMGCGDGWIEKILLSKGAKYVNGIDLSPEVIKKAKKQNLKKVSYRVSDAINLPFKKSSFDVIVAFEVLEHIQPKGEKMMFSEVVRVLKPGGEFFLTTPHKHLFVTLTDPAWWFIKHRHYSLLEIRKFLKDAHLDVKRLYVRGGVYTVFLLLSMYFSKWVTKKPPLFYTFLLNKSREEYRKDNGIMNIFLHAVKPK